LGNHTKKQLIRCAISVAANYRATLLAQTKAAFISKISIVIEEADESEFWLEFIMDEKLMERKKVLPLFNEAHEPHKRAHSPQQAAGLASESKNDKLPYGRRFPAACCRESSNRLQPIFSLCAVITPCYIAVKNLNRTSLIIPVFSWYYPGN